MKIVHVYDGHERVNGDGSVSGVVWDIASRTAERGHDVTVIERRWADLAGTEDADGVHIDRLDLRTGADEEWADIPYDMVKSSTGAIRLLVDRTNFALRTLRRLRRLDPDVVHTHLPFAANVIVTVSPTMRNRMVYTAHIGETDKRITEPTFSPDVYLAKRAAKTVALNRKMRDAFVARGVPEGKLTVIQNGVDINRFADVDPEITDRVMEAFEVNGDPVVLFAGTITPRKGVTELVEAAKDVCAVHDTVQFLIVGWTDIDPEYAEEVQEAISSAGLEDRVVLTGFVPDEEFPSCFDLADLFVLPSYDEGSSVSVTEAMAAGLPVVGSNTDGISQKVEHGRHGLLSDPGDVETLTEHIERLVTDEALRAEMRDEVSEKAEELSWERVTDELLETYTEVAE